MKKDNFTYTTNPENGTVISRGYLELTKGDHSNMPKRTSAYPDGYERGHTNASSLSGGNHRLNVHPQAKDLNHGAFANMEAGERDVLKAGGTIHSEKIAYNTGPKGTAPEDNMVNDTVTHANGNTNHVNLSFANMNDPEQEAVQQMTPQGASLINEYDNPGDVGRQTYSTDEYAQLMEETDAQLGGIRDEYSPDWVEVHYDDPIDISPTDTTVDASVTDDGVDVTSDDGVGFDDDD